MSWKRDPHTPLLTHPQHCHQLSAKRRHRVQLSLKASTPLTCAHPSSADLLYKHKTHRQDMRTVNLCSFFYSCPHPLQTVLRKTNPTEIPVGPSSLAASSSFSRIISRRHGKRSIQFLWRHKPHPPPQGHAKRNREKESICGLYSERKFIQLSWGACPRAWGVME